MSLATLIFKNKRDLTMSSVANGGSLQAIYAMPNHRENRERDALVVGDEEHVDDGLSCYPNQKWMAYLLKDG